VLRFARSDTHGRGGSPASGTLIIVSSDAGPSPVGGPICPNCRQPLRETLRSEQVAAVVTPEGPRAAISVTYCGSCGWTLAAIPAPSRPNFAVRGSPEVAAPKDASTLAGQFQLRCRELIVETITAGFTPGVWIELINSMGAVEAAKHLLSQGQVLPVTPWLVERGRPELTMEHEISQTRWAGLFTDAERADAARRLASVGGPED
jgi:hypothetical protein